MLRRFGGTILAILIAAVGVIGILAFLSARDESTFESKVRAPGRGFADLGARHLRPGEPHARYNSQPPTSGAHVPEAIRRDAVALSDDQILHALENGNVVLVYGTRTPPLALRAVEQALDARFTPGLASEGAAVILVRRRGTRGVTALAWRREQRFASAGDPGIVEFADYWLGRGAGS